MHLLCYVGNNAIPASRCDLARLCFLTGFLSFTQHDHKTRAFAPMWFRVKRNTFEQVFAVVVHFLGISLEGIIAKARRIPIFFVAEAWRPIVCLFDWCWASCDVIDPIINWGCHGVPEGLTGQYSYVMHCGSCCDVCPKDLKIYAALCRVFCKRLWLEGL